jgi:hypothetical protein
LCVRWTRPPSRQPPCPACCHRAPPVPAPTRHPRPQRKPVQKRWRTVASQLHQSIFQHPRLHVSIIAWCLARRACGASANYVGCEHASTISAAEQLVGGQRVCEIVIPIHASHIVAVPYAACRGRSRICFQHRQNCGYVQGAACPRCDSRACLHSNWHGIVFGGGRAAKAGRYSRCPGVVGPWLRASPLPPAAWATGIQPPCAQAMWCPGPPTHCSASRPACPARPPCTSICSGAG